MWLLNDRGFPFRIGVEAPSPARIEEDQAPDKCFGAALLESDQTKAEQFSRSIPTAADQTGIDDEKGGGWSGYGGFLLPLHSLERSSVSLRIAILDHETMMQKYLLHNNILLK